MSHLYFVRFKFGSDSFFDSQCRYIDQIQELKAGDDKAL